MKPTILITGEEVFDPSFGALDFVINRKYADYIAKSGGLPLMPEDIRVANEYVKLAKGLLLTDGPNIHRGRYHKYYTRWEDMKSVCSTRDDFEFTLFKLFYEAKKPIIGIGRGMQIINVALGGDLFIESDKEVPLKDSDLDLNIAKSKYEINFEEQTKLKSIIGEKVFAYSFNSQKIDHLGNGLIISAYSQNSGIEAIEHDTLPICGIQWHPKTVKNEDVNNALFNYFVELCKGDAEI